MPYSISPRTEVYECKKCHEFLMPEENFCHNCGKEIPILKSQRYFEKKPDKKFERLMRKLIYTDDSGNNFIRTTQ